MADQSNNIVVAMIDPQSTQAYNNHDNKDLTAVACAESAAAASPDKDGVDMANHAATDIHEHEHDHEYHHGVTTDDSSQEEDDEEDSSDDDSDAMSEADEAITAINTGFAPPFFIEQTPFGDKLPRDLVTGTAKFDIDYPIKYIENDKDGRSREFYLGLDKSAKAEVAFGVYCPGPREIRVIWSKTHKSWVYCSLRTPNVVPFVATGFDGAMVPYVMKTFNPAPTMGDFMPYGYFNYELDTLVLDYPYCAKRHAEQMDYSRAVHHALTMIQVDQQRNVTLPCFKVVKITYCSYFFGPNDLPRCKCALQSAFCADDVKLVAHEH